MLMFNVTNLDYIATKLEGMAIRFLDNGEVNTAHELSRMSSNLKDMSKDLLYELFNKKDNVIESEDKETVKNEENS
jgi:hypothetical protein